MRNALAMQKLSSCIDAVADIHDSLGDDIDAVPAASKAVQLIFAIAGSSYNRLYTDTLPHHLGSLKLCKFPFTSDEMGEIYDDWMRTASCILIKDRPHPDAAGPSGTQQELPTPGAAPPAPDVPIPTPTEPLVAEEALMGEPIPGMAQPTETPFGDTEAGEGMPMSEFEVGGSYFQPHGEWAMPMWLNGSEGSEPLPSVPTEIVEPVFPEVGVEFAVEGEEARAVLVGLPLTEHQGMGEEQHE